MDRSESPPTRYDIIGSTRSLYYPHSTSRAMRRAMMSRWQRSPSRPCHAHTGHWRAKDIPLAISSTTHQPYRPQPTPKVSGCKAPPASARHGHAVDRSAVVGNGRDRQPRVSYQGDTLARVAACHAKSRPSRLGGGGCRSLADAAPRGGGQDSARSAANEPAAVASGGHGPSAVHGTGAVESRVDVRGRLSDQHGCARELYTTRADPTGA